MSHILKLSTTKAGLAGLFVVLCAGFGFTGCGPDTSKLKEYDIGGDFTLTDHEGRPFQLSRRLAAGSGDPLLLFFGFTHCPDVCPQTLSRLSRAMDLLGEDGRRVETLLITVDPGRDDPAALKAYLANFPLRSTGLTGEEDDIRAIAGRYAVNFYESHSRPAQSEHAGHGAHAAHQSHGGGTAVINHSPQTFLIDGEGKVRYFFRPTDSVRDIADTVRLLL